MSEKAYCRARFIAAFLLHSFTEFNAHIPANALWFTVLAALALKALSCRMSAPGR